MRIGQESGGAELPATEGPLISVVIPVYLNERSLRDLHSRLSTMTAGPHRFEFVFVHDGSPDKSWEVLEEIAADDPRVVLLRLSRNFGSNAAILAGLSVARGRAIGTLSADLQDPPETIPLLVAEWKRGAKVVLAARQSRQDPFLTRMFAGAFYWLFRRFAFSNMPTGGFDFFLVDRSVCDLINQTKDRNAYLMGLLLWFGFNPSIVHYDRQERATAYGQSAWTLGKKVKYFIDAFVGFSYTPLRFASWLGLMVAATGACYAVAILFLRVTQGFAVEGWASLMVAFLVVSGLQLFLMGVMGEYLWRTLDEARQRPRFIIDKMARRDTAD